MQILSDSQFQNIHNHNEFYAFFVTRVFILIICDATVIVLIAFKHLSQNQQNHSRMGVTAPDKHKEKDCFMKYGGETVLYITAH